MSSFSTNKRQLLVCLHLSTTWQHCMRLYPVMNLRQLTYFRSLKNHHVLIFLAVSSSVPNMVKGSASPLTHTWLIESEVLPYLSHLVMTERVGVRDTLSPFHYSLILAYYYRPLIVACYHSRPPASFPNN